MTKTTPQRPRIWLCPCAEPNCGGKILSCVRCKRVHEDVIPELRVCVDLDDCQSFIEARRANNSLYQQVHRIQEEHKMAKAENTKTREPAKPKVGVCKCGCEGATKGGNFLPGHDARLVSTLVGEVIAKKTTEAAARKRMAPFSDLLRAKFDKSLGLAQDKAAKKVEREQAAKAAKAEKAKADKADKA